MDTHTLGQTMTLIGEVWMSIIHGHATFCCLYSSSIGSQTLQVKGHAPVRDYGEPSPPPVKATHPYMHYQSSTWPGRCPHTVLCCRSVRWRPERSGPPLSQRSDSLQGGSESTQAVAHQAPLRLEISPTNGSNAHSHLLKRPC